MLRGFRTAPRDEGGHVGLPLRRFPGLKAASGGGMIREKNEGRVPPSRPCPINGEGTGKLFHYKVFLNCPSRSQTFIFLAKTFIIFNLILGKINLAQS